MGLCPCVAADACAQCKRHSRRQGHSDRQRNIWGHGISGAIRSPWSKVWPCYMSHLSHGYNIQLCSCQLGTGGLSALPECPASDAQCPNANMHPPWAPRILLSPTTLPSSLSLHTCVHSACASNWTGQQSLPSHLSWGPRVPICQMTSFQGPQTKYMVVPPPPIHRRGRFRLRLTQPGIRAQSSQTLRSASPIPRQQV